MYIAWDNLVVTALGIFGIFFVHWFFFMKDEDEVAVVNNTVDIKVDGGYQPDAISIPLKQTTKLNFIRTDPSTCLEEIVMPDFKIRKYLPLNQKTTIEVTPQQPGEFEISCGMNMFHGKIKVDGVNGVTKI